MSERTFVIDDKTVVFTQEHKEWSIKPCNKNPSDIKPLMCIASPRDYPEVKPHRDIIPCDKLWAKYYSEPEAYKILTDYFLTHKEYTHMVIAPDDLIVRKRDFDGLLNDLLNTDYPVLSGICNRNWQEINRYSTYWKCDTSVPLTDDDILSGVPIKRVEFEGFTCPFIRRDVVKSIQFNGHDSELSIECYKNNIPIHIDTRVFMVHLMNRLGRGEMEYWGMGKPSKTMFEPYIGT